MTENGDPYENALAERINRTLNDGFSLDRTFSLMTRQNSWLNKQLNIIIQLGHMRVVLFDTRSGSVIKEVSTTLKASFNEIKDRVITGSFGAKKRIVDGT